VDYYLLIKALHIISFTAWMAGMFYLPRLYAYHANTAAGSAESELFKTMERRLLRAIMNPAMIATFIFGIWLVVLTGYGKPGNGYWLHAKLALVIFGLGGMHGFFAATRKKFERDERPKSSRFYKIINELVTILFVFIVLLAVLKPF
jgi:putative membrane protein